MATGNEADFEHIRQLLGVEIAGHAKSGLPEHGLWAQLKRGGRQVGTLKFRRDADLDMHTTDMVRWLCQREGDLTDLGLGEGEEINLSAFHEQQWSFCAVERSGLLRLVQQAWEHNMARLPPPSPSSSEEDGSEGSEPGSDESGSESGSDGGDPKGELLVEFLGEMEAKTAAQRAALWIIARNIAFQFEVEDEALVWEGKGKAEDTVRHEFLPQVRKVLEDSGHFRFIVAQGPLGDVLAVDEGTEKWIRSGDASSLHVAAGAQARMFNLTLAAATVVNRWDEDSFLRNGMSCCYTNIGPGLKLGELVVSLGLKDLSFEGVNGKTGQQRMLELCKGILFGAQPDEGSSASGSGLHGGNAPGGSSGEPEWLTRHKEGFLGMSEERRAKAYGTALAAAGSTVTKLVDEGTLLLRPEKKDLRSEAVNPFYDRLKAFLEDVFPGGFSEAIARNEFSAESTNERCLITSYKRSKNGPVQVRQLSAGRRGDIVLKPKNQELLFQEDSMITTETDPFFAYMAWPREKKESEWFHGGQLDWHLVVMAIVFVFLELGDGFDPHQVIDPVVFEGVQTITISRDEEDSPGESPRPVTPKKTSEGSRSAGNFSPGGEEDVGDVSGWRCSVM